ncbi:hypothetical protein Ae406Ps2_0628 [Pseudonocardia sp. Ae406_Ps2]|nr:hypothetical protein Ae406Ps2_0624 [Pseudonocardia sp. Ae406_Ps2]OLM07583.1 hypothetical protein Ae331Ps2_5293c [Pseudonocardia sp. Ae331_Ps2]OLM14770.1 hypothetical protein Ae505Ps2_4901c [Pseudonocardia sp. Ae505_Ps2]OLM22199.1 hypothetical protein Ae706Ps2_0631 [Pseudonocardia sp. Ae706_Ps2]OLM00628.1 hypothetical protein Ae406Ps2_0628 [Pseudonocardia sp. Ae406_Ps2]
MVTMVWEVSTCVTGTGEAWMQRRVEEAGGEVWAMRNWNW